MMMRKSVGPGNGTDAKILRSVRQNLLFLVGGIDGKETFAKAFLDAPGSRRVNLGRELSRYLSAEPPFSLALTAQSFLQELHPGCDLFLERIQILFDPGMDIQPINVLMSMARSRRVLVDWPGSFDETDHALVFGDENEACYRRFSAGLGFSVFYEPSETIY